MQLWLCLLISQLGSPVHLHSHRGRGLIVVIFVDYTSSCRMWPEIVATT